MRRILFFPSYMGGGHGHIHRCLTLATELARRQWIVGMVLAGRHADTVRRAGYRTLEPRFPKRPGRPQPGSPAYTCFNDGNGQVLRDGFLSPVWLCLAAAEALYFIRRFRPDVLVGDYSLLVGILGRHTGIPVVQIIQSIAYPGSPGIIWWQKPPDGMKSPAIGRVFSSLLRTWKLDAVDRTEDLLVGDLFLVPSIPALDPVPDSLGNVHYVGPFLYREPGGVDFSEQEHLRSPLVFITLGGSTSSSQVRTAFQVMDQGLGHGPWSVVFTTSQRYVRTTLQSTAPNIYSYDWVPGSTLVARSDLVVFHGGHTTMMEVVHAGVPSVVLPRQSEQEANGRRLAASGAAMVLSPTDCPESMHLMRHEWKYGESATWIQPVSQLTPESLRQAVAHVLSNTSFKQSAMSLRAAVAQYGGARAAAELIEQAVC
jgi:UDP:flavonoid glycosyltransferase YjiC (YdhE family)